MEGDQRNEGAEGKRQNRKLNKKLEKKVQNRNRKCNEASIARKEGKPVEEIIK